MWDVNSINEESRVNFKENPVLRHCCWRFALTNAKGLFESGKFTLKITCESEILFTTGCRLPPKSTNFGTLPLRSAPEFMKVSLISAPVYRTCVNKGLVETCHVLYSGYWPVPSKNLHQSMLYAQTEIHAIPLSSVLKTNIFPHCFISTLHHVKSVPHCTKSAPLPLIRTNREGAAPTKYHQKCHTLQPGTKVCAPVITGNFWNVPIYTSLTTTEDQNLSWVK